MILSTRFWAVVSALWMVLLINSDSSQGQLRLGNLRGDKPTVFAIAPREATRPVKIAAKAIEDGDYFQATELLGDLLADPMLKEYLVADEKQWGRAISLRQRAEQLLGKIPIDRRASYEEKYGVRADVLLKQAIANDDVDAISTISRLYFYTRAGQEATMLTGHEHLSQGRPVMAAAAFEKIASQQQGQQRFDPEATLLAAVSWSLHGANQKASRLLQDLKRRNPENEVRFYGQPVPLFQDDAPVQQWLKEIISATPLQSHPIVQQWLVYRGDSQRNAESGAGFPLISPRWSMATVADPVDEAGIKAFHQQLIQAKISPMPKVHPLAMGDTLVIRTDDRMFGVDANSGKRVWSYPPADVFRSQSQTAKDKGRRQSRSLYQDKLRERLWLDALYGQISSDGDSIFLIPNPGISTDRDDWRSYQRQTYDEPTDLRRYNELKSLDLKQQGALQWRVGGESGMDEPKLAKAFFLGAPLPIGNRLYAICLQEQSIRLVVLESETGRLAWGRHLASTEESVSFREDRLRRLAGATPSEINGILICPTGLNAVVAVDVATESLMWGFQFKAPTRTRVDRLTVQLSKWNSMWRDATITLASGSVVYTPINSNEIYCLDLQTGRPLWKDARTKRSRLKYKTMHVETIRDGKIILTASDRLKAVDLDSGRIVWEQRFDQYGLISGRGYVSGNHCYLPTTAKKIIKVDVSTGDVRGVAMTEKVLGNLICFRGDVISHAADHLTAYPRDQPSRLMVANATPEQLDDHAFLSIQSQLHLLDGEFAQSVDAIGKAYDRFPNSNYANVLVRGLTRLIEVDFAKAEQVSDRYQGLFEKQDLQRLLRGKVKGLMKLNRVEEALTTLMDLLETVEVKPPTAVSAAYRIESDQSVTLIAETVDLEKTLTKEATNAELTLQFNQWLRWKLEEVFQSGDDRLRDKFRNLVDSHLESHRNDSVENRHDRMRMIPADAVSEVSRMQLAAELFARQLNVRASLVAAPLWPSEAVAKESDGSVPSQQPAPLNILSQAQRLLQRMVAEDFNEDQTLELRNVIETWVGQQQTDVSPLNPEYYQPATLASRPISESQRPLLMSDLEVPWKPNVRRVVQQSNESYFISAQHSCNVVQSDQPELKKLLFTYSDDFREFRLHDALGRLVHKIYLDPSGDLQGTKWGTKGRIFLRQSLMLLCIADELYAIDWEKMLRGQSALLWSADGVVCSSSGMASPSQAGICVLKDGMMMCLDPLTGQTLWQRSQVSKRSSLLQGPQFLTLWNRSGRTYDVIDPMVGRILACGQMDRFSGSDSVATGNRQLFVVPRRLRKSPITETPNTETPKDETPRLQKSLAKSDPKKKTYVSVDLNLFDFQRQAVDWSHTVDYPAHMALADQDRLLVFSGDGAFSLIDMVTGEIKFTTKIERLNDELISGISVVRLKDTYLVSVHLVNQQAEYIVRDDLRATFQRMHKSNAMLNGNLIALDAETGAAKWDAPVPVQRFQLLEGMPWDSPFVFLARRNVYESDNTEVRIQLAMVDLKSGRLKANDLFEVPVRDDVFYHVACQPAFGKAVKQSLKVQIATLQLSVELDDFPTAPQPIAALTNRNSFKRIKKESSIPPTVRQQKDDLQALVDAAINAEKERVKLRAKKGRIQELEMPQ